MMAKKSKIESFTTSVQDHELSAIVSGLLVRNRFFAGFFRTHREAV